MVVLARDIPLIIIALFAVVGIIVIMVPFQNFLLLIIVVVGLEYLHKYMV